MLLSTSFREALVAYPPFPPWNLPFFTVESTLSSSCSCSDPSLVCQGAALAHLDSLPSHDLVLWTDGFVPFGKGASGLLGNCFVYGIKATLSFSGIKSVSGKHCLMKVSSTFSNNVLSIQNHVKNFFAITFNSLRRS